MPHGDQKYRHERSSGYTKRERERDRKRSERAQHQRNTMLREMSDPERAAFLAGEEEARNKAKAAAEAQRMAYQIAERDKIEIMQGQSVRLTGYLYSEIATALATRERYGQPEGDWLEDPVQATQGKPAFAEEYNVKRGIRLLVNLCIDCSNSMDHNQVEDAAKAALYTLYAMLDNVAKQLPEGTLVTTVWTWAKYEQGKGVNCLSDHPSAYNPLLTPQQAIIDSIHDIWMNGEDTWIAPLFEHLQQWERRHGWEGEARLDIILTDGVLEHKTDRAKATQIQMERNGGLSTVLLNFLPMSEWADVHLPDRCYQYEATVDNVFTLMSKVLGEWVSMA